MKLKIGKIQKSGRNTHGRITVRHKGGGNKKKLIKVNFGKGLQGVVGKVVSVERDSNRGGFIGLIAYSNGYLGYSLLTKGLQIGSYVMECWDSQVYDGLDILGCRLELRYLKEGMMVHSVELKPGGGACLLRGGGCFGVIKRFEGDNVWIRMPSGQDKKFDGCCLAVVGVVSNEKRREYHYYKAGQKRWLGKRPEVRGVAMNPVDHPHGGGEGKTSGGRHPVTPWGRLTKGVKTRKKKR